MNNAEQIHAQKSTHNGTTGTNTIFIKNSHAILPRKVHPLVLSLSLSLSLHLSMFLCIPLELVLRARLCCAFRASVATRILLRIMGAAHHDWYYWHAKAGARDKRRAHARPGCVLRFAPRPRHRVVVASHRIVCHTRELWRTHGTPPPEWSRSM